MYGECQTVEVAATPEQCFDAMTDFERLPCASILAASCPARCAS